MVVILKSLGEYVILKLEFGASWGLGRKLTPQQWASTWGVKNEGQLITQIIITVVITVFSIWQLIFSESYVNREHMHLTEIAIG